MKKRVHFSTFILLIIAILISSCVSDRDGDGFVPPEDCDEGNPDVNPGAVEDENDGIDNNCDGMIDTNLLAFVWATPNPCTITPGSDTCTTTISWVSSKILRQPNVVIKVSYEQLPEGVIVNCSDSGMNHRTSPVIPSISIPWIGTGDLTFSIHASPDCVQHGPAIHSITVWGEQQGSANIWAYPSSCVIKPSEEYCSTTIFWSSENVPQPRVQVYVEDITGTSQLMKCSLSNIYDPDSDDYWVRTSQEFDYINRNELTFKVIPALDCDEDVSGNEPIGQVTIGATTSRPDGIIIKQTPDYDGYFYDQINQEIFYPRGSHYPQFGWLVPPWGDRDPNWGHAVFDVGYYDSDHMSSVLQKMKFFGYNTIRVFLNGHPSIHTSEPGMGPQYMENVADFLRLCKQNDIGAILVFRDYLPFEYWDYEEYWNSNPEYIDHYNANFLLDECIRARKDMTRDFINNLKMINAPLDAIFAYSLENEIAFHENEKPFTLSGPVPTAAGTYDMSIEGEKERMMEDNLRYLIDEIAGVIRETDENAFVTLGFYYNEFPDPNTIGIPPLSTLYDSNLDFLSLSMYQDFADSQEGDFETVIRDYGYTGRLDKPLFMQEFGYFFVTCDTIDEARSRASQWITDSCDFGFDGWVFYTWSPQEHPPGEFHMMSLEDGNYEINKGIAPIYRPNVCG
ncbi:putative metal-binding motif-containing protein [Nanoarchaeota archaeon]